MSDPRALDLYPGAKPCIQSGYCCRVGPCAFGTWSEEKHACIHLTEDDLCGIYEQIISLPVEQWWANPAFGAGCSSTGNERRLRKLAGSSPVLPVFVVVEGDVEPNGG